MFSLKYTLLWFGTLAELVSEHSGDGHVYAVYVYAVCTDICVQ